MSSIDQISAYGALLRNWLAPRLDADRFHWLEESTSNIASADHPAALGISVGLAPRKLGKADLALTSLERAAGDKLRPGLDASGWSLDQTARILFVLAIYDGNDTRFVDRLGTLFRSGELGEQIAILRGLPLYPAPVLLIDYAAEGVRSAMQPVFEAVAHQNPYPLEQFSEAQWNQMVVKALFIGSRLAPIQGLDERRNPDLAQMLVDYAHERWAAGRPVSPELWRCVGPYAGEAEIGDLVKVIEQGADAEAAAAALALAECPLPLALAALKSRPALSAGIRDGHITWDQIE